MEGSSSEAISDSRADDTILRVSQLRYSYPTGLQALDGLDLDLQAGELIAIVGPSGCGKSTFLSLIAGLIEPTGGSFAWNEELLQRLGFGGHRLSMVFQRDTVFPWRSVEKNIQFGMECAGIPKRERGEWTDKLLQMGNLEAFRHAQPRALSGGMRRRVALLMGLSVRPGVLLLDEPFGALDEPTRVELLGDVLSFAHEAGVSAILVTHDLGEAVSVADHVYVLSNRPARVKRVLDIGFGRERDVVAIRESAEYADLYSELWHELWEAIRDDHAG